VEDAAYTRKRLSEEWTALITRAVASGIAKEPIVETMLEVALSEYRDSFGDDLLGNYLRDVLLHMEQPVTPREVAEQLIVGREETEPSSSLL
jgi:hypothetical protein